MPLTGKDVQEAVFTTSRKGYSKDEVDDFLDRVVESLEEYRNRLTQLEGQLGISSPAGPQGDLTAGFAAPAASSPPAAPVTTAVPAEPGGSKPAAPPSSTPPSPSPAPASPQPSGAPGPASGAPDATADASAGHQAGWYPDPWQQASERFYDGKEWTAQTR